MSCGQGSFNDMLALLFALLLLCIPCLSYRISCITPTTRLAPYDDCTDVLQALKNVIEPTNIPYAGWPQIWSTAVAYDPQWGTIEIPRGFQLRKLNPKQPRSNNCEIYVDVVAGKEGEADQFGYETLKSAVNDMLLTCYPRGKTGVVDPTGAGIVRLSARWTAERYGGARAGRVNATVSVVAIGDVGNVTIA